MAYQPGWRWQALDLLREAEKLCARPRRADQSEVSSRLPSREELRREAVATLLLEDARPLPPVTIAASTGQSRAISRDGRRILAGFTHLPGKLGVQPKVGLRLFDLSDGRQIAELLDPTLLYRSKALSPDGTFLAVEMADRSGIQLLNLPDGTLRDLAVLQGPTPALAKASSSKPLVFSPDGRYLAGVRSDLKQSDLYVWDLRDPAASRHLTRIDASVADISFRNDGRTLAYSAGGTKVGVIDLQTGGEPRTINLPLPIALGPLANPFQPHEEKIAWLPSSAVLAVACTNATGQASIVFWDTDRQVELARWNGNFALKSLRIACSADGKRLAVSDADGAIRIYDIAAQREVLRLEAVHANGASMLQWTADGRLLSADSFGNSFAIWEPSRESLSSILVSGKDIVGQMIFSPDGRRLGLLRIVPQPTLALIERDSGQTAIQLPVSADSAWIALCFRPDGQQVALLGPRQVVVYDLPAGPRRPIPNRFVPVGGNGISKPSFLADGRLLAVEMMGTEREIHLSVRDMLSGREAGPEITMTVAAESDPFQAGIQPHLSPDGRLLLGLSGGSMPSNDAVAIWDVASGARVGELSSPDQEMTAPITGAGLSADGRWLCNLQIPSNDVLGMDTSRVRLRVWDVANRRHYRDVGITGSPSAVVMSSDGRLLAIGYENGSVEMWDTAAKEMLFQWRAARWPGPASGIHTRCRLPRRERGDGARSSAAHRRVASPLGGHGTGLVKRTFSRPNVLPIIQDRCSLGSEVTYAHAGSRSAADPSSRASDHGGRGDIGPIESSGR